MYVTFISILTKRIYLHLHLHFHTVDDSEDKMTFRQVLEKFLNGRYGQTIEYISTFLSVFSCTVYLVTTYTYNFQWFQDLNLAIELFYLLEYVLR